MRDHPVDRADPNRERRPVLSRTATAARRFVLSRRGGNQSETDSNRRRLRTTRSLKAYIIDLSLSIWATPIINSHYRYLILLSMNPGIQSNLKCRKYCSNFSPLETKYKRTFVFGNILKYNERENVRCSVTAVKKKVVTTQCVENAWFVLGRPLTNR